jgi:cytidylate kinase
MPVVTVSSQFGAGARQVGRVIADQLVLQYVDQAVLVDAARQLGVTVKSVAKHDERTDSFRQRLGHFLQRALERSAAGGHVDPLMGAGNLELMLAQSYQDVMESEVPAFIDDRTYLETVTSILEDLARRGDMLFIGRGSQMILRDRADALHVQLVADEDARVERVMQWESVNRDEARRRARDFNRHRAAFHKKFWRVDVWDPRLYDVVINTTSIGYEDAAAIACAAVESKLRVAAGAPA